MGECYNPYPKLPKNIRQIGERDPVLKLYVEDYVNTYLKRLYPTGGQDLRVGLLLGENREEDGVPYLFVDGALEMEGASIGGEKVEFSEELWKKAYRDMEQMFPRRIVLGWFLCGAPGAMLSPLNYWKQHGTYFSGKNQLMYVNSGLEGEEAVYTASEDGFYKLRGYNIYYEKNQMMQDYMVSRKDARRIESQTRDGVIRDFRKKMEENQVKAGKRKSLTGTLGTACGILSLVVLAGGVVMVNNYHKMQQMEAVIASVVPEGSAGDWTRILKEKTGQAVAQRDGGTADEVEIEHVPGEVYPTLAEIQLGDAGDNSANSLNSSNSPSSSSSSGSAGSAEPSGMSGTDGAEGSGQSANGEQMGEHESAVSAGAGASGSGTGSQAESSSFSASSASSGSSSESDSSDPSGPQNSANKSSAQNSSASSDSQSQQSQQSQQVTIQVSIPSNAISHVVQTGETLYGICMERYHSLANLETICAWNQLGDGSHLSVGQKIYLPPENNP